MKKNLCTRQVENLKRRLGQKWVSRWTENPKGRSRQKLRIEAYEYVSSSRHLPTRRRFVNRQSSSASTGISSHRNRGSNELSKRSSYSVHQGTKIGSAEEQLRCLNFPRRVQSESLPRRVQSISPGEFNQSPQQVLKLIPRRFGKLIPCRAQTRLPTLFKGYFPTRI